MIGFFTLLAKYDHGSMKEVLRASEKVKVDISLISAPAAKAFWEPVNIIDVILEEELNSVNAALSSAKRGVERALRALGRLSVTGRCC